jgi:LysM repeat protein
MNTRNLLPPKLVLVGLILLTLLAAVVPPVTRAAPPRDGSIVYFVQYGDTLFSISRRFGTSVPAIVAANGLPSYNVYAGQRLIIPVGYPSYGYMGYSSIYAPKPLPTVQLLSNPTFGCKYTVQSRDTAFSISYRFQVTVPSLMQANNLYSPFIYVGQQLNVPCLTTTPASFPIYTVQTGDDLFRIAIQYNTSIYAIAIVNGIPNPNLIFVGQNLVIPYAGSYVWPTGIATLQPYPTPTGTITPGTATPTPTATFTPLPTITVPPNTSVVVMQNIAYNPPALTISVGQTVLWENMDTVSHTVSSGTPGNLDNKFRSSTLPPGQTFSFQFTTAGTYPYFCEIHGASMVGTITVQ